MFQQANANSTYYLAKTPYFELCTSRFRSWLKHHGLPVCLQRDFLDLLQVEWRKHLDSLQLQHRFSFHAVQDLLRWLPRHCIIHHGDHEQYRISIFCPRLYFRGALNTWRDPDLFESVPITVEEAKRRIKTAFPRHIQTRYPWGFRQKAELPYGFVFLKRKKQWPKGRTLISYFQAFASTLLKAASRALDSMLQETWPQIMGQLSTPQIWQRVHQLFTETDPAVHLVAINDDLVGFFNSVPQDRLLDAVSSLIAAWEHHHGSGLSISVDLSRTGDPVQSTYAGQIRRTGFSVKALRVQDLLTIVRSSLQSHLFSALGIIWRQFRGAGIGSQISPTLSNLAVTIIERSWQQCYSALFAQPPSLFSFVAIRYVDNRFAIVNSRYINLEALRTFAELDFYGLPVELEKVTDDSLLGFSVNVEQRSCQYQLPNLRQIRDLESAGSLRLRMSGLLSRAHLIRQYTYPRSQITPTLHSLAELYIAKGYPTVEVSRSLRIHLHYG
eukprot:Skav216066  [mRNA]  locus=scaffold2261:170570:172063:- [translate_table: standard]